MRKSATKRSKTVLAADRNPAGSKLIRGFCRAALKVKYSLAESIAWAKAYDRKLVSHG